MPPIAGVGFLIANDILTDCSNSLFQPVVNVVVPAGGIPIGNQTVAVWDPSLYVGAFILVGVLGGNLEVVRVTATVPGTSFTAVFVNAHAAGEPIVGATFPVYSIAGDPLFTQGEMLGYLAAAINDFLVACPLVYAIDESTSVSPTQPATALPADCMTPVRIAAFGLALRETSQSWLDSVDYRWQTQAADEPYVYFRDKIGLQKFGTWPRANNTVPLEIVYQQRSPEFLGLGDGFLLPDPFMVYVKARVLEFAYSKDGDQRSPGQAQFWNARYETGVKIASVFLEAMMDPNEQQ